MDTHLIDLCTEYIEYVDASSSGLYPLGELHQIDSQRQVTHNEILRYTHRDRSMNFDMHQFAQWVIRSARTEGQIE